MEIKSLADNNFYNDLVTEIRKKFEEQINKEYTDLRNQYLDTLVHNLELKRNEVVKSVLDTIDIRFRQGELDISPVIQIQITKNKEVDKNDRR